MSASNRSRLVERVRTLASPLSPLSSDHPTRLTQISGIQCVAFDFYGTMFMSAVGDIGIDEEQDQESEKKFLESLEASGFEIQNQAAGLKGIEVLKETLDHHLAEAKEKGIAHPEPEIRDVWKETLGTLQNRSLIQGHLDEDTIARFAIEFEFRINAIWPVPELVTTLDKLKEMQLSLGIISNSQFYTPIAFEAMIGQSPEEFGFDPDLMVWSFATGLKKPDIRFYQTFIERIQEKEIEPKEVLYVGNDIRKDIQPAKKLGMRTALYVGDSRSIRHEQYELGEAPYSPDLIIESLDQITNCLL